MGVPAMTKPPTSTATTIAPAAVAKLRCMRRVFTAGGGTACIDMAFRVVADIAGEEASKRIQLQIEYDPEPPFRSGTPFTASPGTIPAQREAGAARRKIREAAVAKAAEALKIGQK